MTGGLGLMGGLLMTGGLGLGGLLTGGLEICLGCGGAAGRDVVIEGGGIEGGPALAGVARCAEPAVLLLITAPFCAFAVIVPDGGLLRPPPLFGAEFWESWDCRLEESVLSLGLEPRDLRRDLNIISDFLYCNLEMYIIYFVKLID